jgi:ADP-heptose:LPS heptosyltransferase
MLCSLGLPVELTWLRHIEFFPGRPEKLDKMRSICIGTKSRNLGDALALTTLPRKLKEKHPHLRVNIYPRAFNPVVFLGNPYVDGISRIPKAVYGDDTNYGAGQLIELKEQFFDLTPPASTHPELYLLQEEKVCAEKLITPSSKPLVFLHPTGVTRSAVTPLTLWEELVARWNSKFRFWQIGIEGHRTIAGCERHVLTPRHRASARLLFALMPHAQAFIGVDSGPMHVASAFEIPSCILVGHLDPHAALSRRRTSDYYLHGNWKASPLYAQNRHIHWNPENTPSPHKELDSFLQNFIQKQ